MRIEDHPDQPAGIREEIWGGGQGIEGGGKMKPEETDTSVVEKKKKYIKSTGR